MLMFVSLHCEAWDNMHCHCAVCTSSHRVCPNTCRFQRVHSQVPFSFKLFVFGCSTLIWSRRTARGSWLPLGNLAAAAFSLHSMFPMNIAMAYLFEDKAILEAFVADLRAAVPNCDHVASINWDRACEAFKTGI